jgi:hypothetical protein
MLRYLLELIKVVASVIPLLQAKADKKVRVRNGEKLFEMRILFEQLMDTASFLLDFIRSRDSVNLLQVPKEELKGNYNMIQVYISLQLERLKRIRVLLEESDILSIELPDVKQELKKLVGSKSQGLYSIGAAMQFDLMFGFLIVRDEGEIDFAKSSLKQNNFVRSIIANNWGKECFDIAEQRNIIQDMKTFVADFSKVIEIYLEPTERIQCYKIAKDKADAYNYRS